jgi:hypothetical protein
MSMSLIGVSLGNRFVMFLATGTILVINDGRPSSRRRIVSENIFAGAAHRHGLSSKAKQKLNLKGVITADRFPRRIVSASSLRASSNYAH